MAKDAQGKQMGQGCPRRNKWDKGAYKQCNKKSPKQYESEFNDHIESLREE